MVVVVGAPVVEGTVVVVVGAPVVEGTVVVVEVAGAVSRWLVDDAVQATRASPATASPTRAAPNCPEVTGVAGVQWRRQA